MPLHKGNDCFMPIESLFTEAMSMHRSGDLDNAEKLYKNILSRDPDNPDVLNLLGVLSLQSEKLKEAERFIRKAIAVDSSIAEYHFNLGEVLLHNDDKYAAIQSYRKSLEINPNLEIAKKKLVALGGCVRTESGEDCNELTQVHGQLGRNGKNLAFFEISA